MSFHVIDAQQRSDEWFAARCGLLTASCAKDMLSTIKSGESAARRDLRVRLVVERLTGRTEEDGYVNADMVRGVTMEADARSAYEAQTGTLVQQVGFCRHESILAGCSPDGVIDGFVGLVELKVPRSANHLRYLRAGGIPTEHKPQLLHALWVTGAQFIDFASFDDRMPEGLQLFVCRMERDEVEILAYEKSALAFLSEVETELASLRTMANVGTVLREAVA